MLEADRAVEEPASADFVASSSPSPEWQRRMRFWRSPEDQPRWARPALLAVTALAGLAYAWGMNSAYLEPFYGAAARSMAMSWHNFFFATADPWGTVSVDKLPGALWFQTLSVRIFGFHVWALVLPQVIEGMLTVLVVYRAVRRVPGAGAGAGIVAAIVMAGSPIVVLLDRGNISDSLLILLLVLAADATLRSIQSGRLRTLVWAGVLVGFAFQAKMLQAWLVLPAFALAYLVAAPAASLLRRAGHVALSLLATFVVSLSWMTAVTAFPQADRPFVDGSCNDSVFNQVFSYNGLDRIGSTILNSPGCSRPSQYLITLAHTLTQEGVGLSGIAPSWHRLLSGPFGRDDAWLLLPAVVAALALFWLRRHAPRTDPLRAATILWSGWLVLTFGFFSGGNALNSYYVAALIPPVAALCGMGAAAAWQRRRAAGVRILLAVLVAASVGIVFALVPGDAGVRTWILASALVVGLFAVAILAASLRRGHDSVWAVTVGPALAAAAILLSSFWASALVVAEGLSPFDSPYATAAANTYTREAADALPVYERTLLPFVKTVPADQAADVFETSAATGEQILATGREFLPVGGYTGLVPAPSLARFKQLVAERRVRRVTVVTQPLTRAPDLRWVAAHCQSTTDAGYVPVEQATRVVFYCNPRDA